MQLGGGRGLVKSLGEWSREETKGRGGGSFFLYKYIYSSLYAWELFKYYKPTVASLTDSDEISVDNKSQSGRIILPLLSYQSDSLNRRNFWLGKKNKNYPGSQQIVVGKVLKKSSLSQAWEQWKIYSRKSKIYVQRLKSIEKLWWVWWTGSWLEELVTAVTFKIIGEVTGHKSLSATVLWANLQLEELGSRVCYKFQEFRAAEWKVSDNGWTSI